MITHLNHSEIDKQKWDTCIESSINHKPYGYSRWLDAVSPFWDALIMDDYRAVLPLTHKRKFNLDYLYQPVYTQQLGIFSTDYLTLEETNSLFEKIPGKYRYIDIQLNADFVPTTAEFNLQIRSNYLLDLSPEYDTLFATYHRNCRRNLQKAVHSNLTVKPGPLPTVFGHFIEHNLQDSIENPGKHMFAILPGLCEYTIQEGKGEILGVYGPNNDLLAAGWFVRGRGSIYFLVCASTPAGKQRQAMYCLVDHVIRLNAGKKGNLDFTGSNIPGVAYFNSGFGAVKKTYPVLKVNRLPWLVRLFKR